MIDSSWFGEQIVNQSGVAHVSSFGTSIAGFGTPEFAHSFKAGLHQAGASDPA